MKNKEIVVTIDGLGNIKFYKINKKYVSDFVLEKSEEGYLVSVLNSDLQAIQVSDDKICFELIELDYKGIEE